MNKVEQKYGKAYWFDGAFDADLSIDKYPDPLRWTMNIEETIRRAKKEDADRSQIDNISDLLRKQQEVNNAF